MQHFWYERAVTRLKYVVEYYSKIHVIEDIGQPLIMVSNTQQAGNPRQLGIRARQNHSINDMQASQKVYPWPHPPRPGALSQ
jgi:hypothetical protein